MGRSLCDLTFSHDKMSQTYHSRNYNSLNVCVYCAVNDYTVTVYVHNDIVQTVTMYLNALCRQTFTSSCFSIANSVAPGAYTVKLE